MMQASGPSQTGLRVGRIWNAHRHGGQAVRFTGFAVLSLLLVLGAMMAQTQDGAAAAGMAKVEFENEQIRVVRVSYAPHQKSAMHSHLGRLVVTLTNNNLRISQTDGKARTVQWKAHEYFWGDAVTHQVENLSNEPMENIEIEFKLSKAAGVEVKPPNKAAVAGTGTEKDPVPVEREPHHHVVFENQYLRLLDVVVPPAEMTLFHTHSLDNVAVLLADTTLKNQNPGEEWTERPITHGSVGFRAGTKTPYTHRIMNTGVVVFHVMDVEILP
jgi:quercetin dioxygenase-like cupin family protein